MSLRGTSGETGGQCSAPGEATCWACETSALRRWIIAEPSWTSTWPGGAFWGPRPARYRAKSAVSDVWKQTRRVSRWPGCDPDGRHLVERWYPISTPLSLQRPVPPYPLLRTDTALYGRSNGSSDSDSARD